jgi:hypothetical protein
MHADETGAREGAPMVDIIMIGSAVAFFALAIGYTYACERL